MWIHTGEKSPSGKAPLSPNTGELNAFVGTGEVLAIIEKAHHKSGFHLIVPSPFIGLTTALKSNHDQLLKIEESYLANNTNKQHVTNKKNKSWNEALEKYQPAHKTAQRQDDNAETALDAIEDGSLKTGLNSEGMKLRYLDLRGISSKEQIYQQFKPLFRYPDSHLITVDGLIEVYKNQINTNGLDFNVLVLDHCSEESVKNIQDILNLLANKLTVIIVADLMMKISEMNRVLPGIDNNIHNTVVVSKKSAFLDEKTFSQLLLNKIIYFTELFGISDIADDRVIVLNDSLSNRQLRNILPILKKINSENDATATTDSSEAIANDKQRKGMLSRLSNTGDIDDKIVDMSLGYLSLAYVYCQLPTDMVNTLHGKFLRKKVSKSAKLAVDKIEYLAKAILLLLEVQRDLLFLMFTATNTSSNANAKLIEFIQELIVQYSLSLEWKDRTRYLISSVPTNTFTVTNTPQDSSNQSLDVWKVLLHTRMFYSLHSTNHSHSSPLFVFPTRILEVLVEGKLVPIKLTTSSIFLLPCYQDILRTYIHENMMQYDVPQYMSELPYVQTNDTVSVINASNEEYHAFYPTIAIIMKMLYLFKHTINSNTSNVTIPHYSLGKYFTLHLDVNDTESTYHDSTTTIDNKVSAYYWNSTNALHIDIAAAVVFLLNTLTIQRQCLSFTTRLEMYSMLLAILTHKSNTFDMTVLTRMIASNTLLMSFVNSQILTAGCDAQDLSQVQVFLYSQLLQGSLYVLQDYILLPERQKEHLEHSSYKLALQYISLSSATIDQNNNSTAATESKFTLEYQLLSDKLSTILQTCTKELLLPCKHLLTKHAAEVSNAVNSMSREEYCWKYLALRYYKVKQQYQILSIFTPLLYSYNYKYSINANNKYNFASIMNTLKDFIFKTLQQLPSAAMVQGTSNVFEVFTDIIKEDTINVDTIKFLQDILLLHTRTNPVDKIMDEQHIKVLQVLLSMQSVIILQELLHTTLLYTNKLLITTAMNNTGSSVCYNTNANYTVYLTQLMESRLLLALLSQAAAGMTPVSRCHDLSYLMYYNSYYNITTSSMSGTTSDGSNTLYNNTEKSLYYYSLLESKHSSSQLLTIDLLFTQHLITLQNSVNTGTSSTEKSTVDTAVVAMIERMKFIQQSQQIFYQVLQRIQVHLLKIYGPFKSISNANLNDKTNDNHHKWSVFFPSIILQSYISPQSVFHNTIAATNNNNSLTLAGANKDNEEESIKNYEVVEQCVLYYNQLIQSSQGQMVVNISSLAALAVLVLLEQLPLLVYEYTAGNESNQEDNDDRSTTSSITYQTEELLVSTFALIEKPLQVLQVSLFTTPAQRTVRSAHKISTLSSSKHWSMLVTYMLMHQLTTLQQSQSLKNILATTMYATDDGSIQQYWEKHVQHLVRELYAERSSIYHQLQSFHRHQQRMNQRQHIVSDISQFKVLFESYYVLQAIIQSVAMYHHDMQQHDISVDIYSNVLFSFQDLHSLYTSYEHIFTDSYIADSNSIVVAPLLRIADILVQLSRVSLHAGRALFAPYNEQYYNTLLSSPTSNANATSTSMNIIGNSVPDIYYQQSVRCLMRSALLYDALLPVELSAHILIPVFQQLANIHCTQNELSLARDCFENILKIFAQVPVQYTAASVSMIERGSNSLSLMQSILRDSHSQTVSDITSKNLKLSLATFHRDYAFFLLTTVNANILNYLTSADSVSSSSTLASELQEANVLLQLANDEFRQLSLQESSTSTGTEGSISINTNGQYYKLMIAENLLEYGSTLVTINTTINNLENMHLNSLVTSANTSENTSSMQILENVGRMVYTITNNVIMYTASIATNNPNISSSNGGTSSYYEEAQPVIEQALLLLEECYRHDEDVMNSSVKIARCYALLGVIHHYFEEFNESLIYLERAHKVYMTVDGPAALSAVKVLHNIAAVLADQGKKEEAKEKYEAVVATLLRWHSKQYHQIVSSMENLHGILLALDKINEAKDVEQYLQTLDSKVDKLVDDTSTQKLALNKQLADAFYDARGKSSSTNTAATHTTGYSSMVELEEFIINLDEIVEAQIDTDGEVNVKTEGHEDNTIIYDKSLSISTDNVNNGKHRGSSADSDGVLSQVVVTEGTPSFSRYNRSHGHVDVKEINTNSSSHGESTTGRLFTDNMQRTMQHIFTSRFAFNNTNNSNATNNNDTNNNKSKVKGKNWDPELQEKISSRRRAARGLSINTIAINKQYKGNQDSRDEAGHQENASEYSDDSSDSQSTTSESSNNTNDNTGNCRIM